MNHIETIDIKRNESILASSFKQSTEVTIDAAVQDALFDAVEKDLKQISPRIIVVRADLSEYSAPQTEQLPKDLKQFRTLYFLAKSKKLERQLAGSSLS